jgi:hypothetical protein
MRRRVSSVAWLVAAAVIAAAPAAAQNWEFDARKIALGAAGSHDIADRVLEDQRPYRSIVLPIGLIQVLKDRDIFRPSSEQFDLVRAIEYSASPFHYIIGRDSSDSAAGQRLVVDIRNASVSRDLNAYRGFVPARQPAAEGLAAPSWGGTIRVAGARDGANQGIFIGAGPYLAMRTGFDIDQRIIDTLASSTNVYFPNSQLTLGNTTVAQLAVAVSGGYRGRFAAGASPSSYLLVAVDYHHLFGFRYEDIDTAVRLDTDGAGLLTLNPLAAPPLLIGRDRSDSGRGFAIDAGVAAIVNGWEAGVSVNGIANRINWRDVQRDVRFMGNLLAGQDVIVDGPDVPVGGVRVELPVDFRIRGGRRGDRLSAIVEYAHGFNGNSFRGGVEQRLVVIDLRAGAYYSRETWQPTAGIGLNLGPRLSLDVAVFGTSANVQRERRTAVAASIRLNR